MPDTYLAQGRRNSAQQENGTPADFVYWDACLFAVSGPQELQTLLAAALKRCSGKALSYPRAEQPAAWFRRKKTKLNSSAEALCCSAMQQCVESMTTHGMAGALWTRF